MTWKRVGTAVVLMPVVIVLVLWGSTTVVAMAVAVLTAGALWEYFGLGETIGHRAYRVWTVVCAVLLIYAQWAEAYGHGGNDRLYRLYCFSLPPITEILTPLWVFFLFVVGLTGITVWGKRALVEALPAAGISSSALLLVAFPLSYAVPLHGLGGIGPQALFFACAITWAGDWEAFAGAELVAEEDLGRVGWGHGRVAGGSVRVQLLDQDSGGAFAGDGGDRECGGTDGRFAGVGV